MDRTLMSALADLSGFYPPTGDDIWNQEISNWQPIPVHTVPEKLDDILAAKKSCPVYDYEFKKLLKSQEFRAYDKKFKPIFNYLTKNAGKTVDSLQSVQNLFSCLHIEELYNFTLPEWTKKVYPEKMFEISGLAFASKTFTPLLARLKSGPLLKEILNHFLNKTRGKLSPNRNVFIYSAHDTTIANILNTLGVFKDLGYHNPGYTATVLFELYEISNERQNGNNNRQNSDNNRQISDKKYFIQVFYKNSTEAKLLDLPKCGSNTCGLEKMFEAYKDVLPINWADECQLSILQMPLEANIEESLSLMTIFGFIALMFIVGMFVLFFAMAWNKQRRGGYLSEEKWASLNNEWN